MQTIWQVMWMVVLQRRGDDRRTILCDTWQVMAMVPQVPWLWFYLPELFFNEQEMADAQHLASDVGFAYVRLSLDILQSPPHLGLSGHCLLSNDEEAMTNAPYLPSNRDGFP
mmetsp:Transcript_24836/g.40274  ORF Transcript_24836/g.40274 Transcript_24836/m.40274 type:complete len:112 (+) Transcript_24836:5769-6104(+)